MASKGNLGIKINLNLIPCRENNMTPYEIMLSESQERMLIVLKKGKEKEARKIFEKWGLDFAIIGQLTNSKKLELDFNKKNVCSIPIHSLGDNAPKYKKSFTRTSYLDRVITIAFLCFYVRNKPSRNIHCGNGNNFIFF